MKEEATRLCKGECGETLPLSEFRIKMAGNGRCYPDSRCRPCERLSNAQYTIRKTQYFDKLAALPGWLR